MKGMHRKLRAWLIHATDAVRRGDETLPAGPRLDLEVSELPAPKRPLPAWSDRELGSLLCAQLHPLVPPRAREWEERVRRVVGLHRRDPHSAARARAPSRLAANGLLARWAAVLAVAAWRTGDLPMLDALLTLLDALGTPASRALRIRALERDLVRFARAVAEARLARLQVAS